MSIKAIDSTSIHRITSGQVVTDLQTAVKELLENSLDASATSIEVRFKNYGLTSVEVIDNGHGIREQDYQSIALKHHTSKLSEYSDLATMKTFGFRGEALSSLCALSSSLTVVTATAEQAPVGTILEFSQDGKLKASRGKLARNKGTTINVSGLFTPLPVRRKEFERNVKREYMKALSILHSYALVPCTKENGGVRLVVTNQHEKGSRTIQLQTDGTSSLKASVLGLWGPKSLHNVVPLNLAFTVAVDSSATLRKRGFERVITIPVEVQGLISDFSSGCGRASTERQFFFVNGRPCFLNKIQKIFNEIYRSFNSGQAPFLIADFRLPTEAYDINVSPDKRTIFLHHEEVLIQALKESIEETFSSSRSTYNINHTLSSSISRAKPNDSLMSNTLPSSSDEVGTLETSDKPEISQDLTLENDGDSAVTDSSRAVPLRPNTRDAVIDKQRHGRVTDTTKNLPLPEMESYTISIDSNPDTADEPPKKRLKTDKSATSVLDTKNAAWNLRRSVYMAQSGPSHSESNHHVVPTVDIQPSKHESDTLTTEDNVDSPHIRQTNTRVPLDDFTDTIETIDMQLCDDDIRQVRSDHLPDDSPISGAESNTEPEFDPDVRELTQTNSIPSPPPEVIRTLMSKAGLKLDLRRLQKVWQQLRSETPVHEDTVHGTFGCLEKHAGVNNDINEAEQELTRVINKEDFGLMRVMGQFNLGFVITRLRPNVDVDDLFIIDQHAADEKYNFETLQQSTRIESQKLLQPQSIELTSAEELTVVDNLHVLRDNGFEVKLQEDAAPGSGKRVQLISQPVSKDTNFDTDDLAELLYLIRDNPGRKFIRCSKARAMFAMRACRKSVMIGMPLTTRQMISIVRNMGSMDQPWHCPHGRPTMRHLVNLHSFNGFKRDILWTQFSPAHIS